MLQYSVCYSTQCATVLSLRTELYQRGCNLSEHHEALGSVLKSIMLIENSNMETSLFLHLAMSLCSSNKAADLL